MFGLENGEKKVIYYRNGIAILNFPDGEEAKRINLRSAIKASEIVNFNLKDDENWADIVKDFFNLRVELMKRNFKGNVQIVNRTIIVNEGRNQKFYIMENGIKEANLLESININLAPEKKHKKAKKKTPKIIQKIKKYIETRKNNIQLGREQKSSDSKRQEWIEQNNLISENSQDIISVIDENNNNSHNLTYTKKESNERN